MTVTLRRPARRARRADRAAASRWLACSQSPGSALLRRRLWLNSILITPTIVMGLAGLGLNLLMGYAGLVSLGIAAFMSIGAFSAYNLLLRAA